MHILYAVPEFVTEKESGGLATYIDNISRSLVDSGHKVTIVVISEKNDVIEYYFNIVVYRIKVQIDGLNQEIPGIIYRAWSKTINSFIEEMQKNGAKFDIVQYANWHAFGLERTRIPTVVRISSDLPLWRAASKYEFDTKIKYECLKVTDYLEDIAMMRADGIISPSVLLADIVGERCGIKIDVIESPYYPLKKQDKKINVEGNYIFTFGTIKLMKGIRLIAESIKEILENNPNLKYVLAGADSVWIDEFGKKFEAVKYILDSAGEYADRIIYMGKISREEVGVLAEKALACVLPSRIDNLPNACIEAMAVGGIVIGTKGASFEQLIEDGVNGFLIDRDNRQQLILAIEKALHLNMTDSAAMRIKARERIKKMDMKVIGEKMVSYYSDVINTPRLYKNNYYTLMRGKYNLVIEKYSHDMILAK